jgi:ABC-type Fe3+-hydroxamate transport system substrate-binding protein
MTYPLHTPRSDQASLAGRRLRPTGLAAAPTFGLTFALAIAISACASPTAGTDVNSTTPTAAAIASASSNPATASDGATSTAPSSAAKVSANAASTAELVAALEAANVANADRWAREIMEYRPYDTNDATLQHLQEELAKYNPDPVTLAAILSVLTP